jgi:hypothetical protein
LTTLFTSEPYAKQYQVALDEIADIPKKVHMEGTILEGFPPISILILEAAHTYLSDEVLLMPPEESYERKLHEDRKQG